MTSPLARKYRPTGYGENSVSLRSMSGTPNEAASVHDGGRSSPFSRATKRTASDWGGLEVVVPCQVLLVGVERGEVLVVGDAEDVHGGVAELFTEAARRPRAQPGRRRGRGRSGRHVRALGSTSATGEPDADPIDEVEISAGGAVAGLRDDETVEDPFGDQQRPVGRALLAGT